VELLGVLLTTAAPLPSTRSAHSKYSLALDQCRMWFLIAGVIFASQVHGNQNGCAIAPAGRTAADEAQLIYTFSNDVHTRSPPNDGHCNYSLLVQISERSLRIVGGMFVH